jgi:hypothetical protein
MLALWDLETAGGRRQWNYNFGNLVAFDESTPYYVADDSGNLRRFQAYSDASAGASEFLRELLSKEQQNRGLHSGNPVVFARGLKAHGYYEAPVERYAKALAERWERYAVAASVPQRRSARGGGVAAVFFSRSAGGC